MPVQNRRILGIRVQNISTTEGESRPTQVFAVLPDGTTNTFDLDTAEAEVDFIRGRYPTSHRPIEAGESIESFSPRHITWKPVKGDLSSVPNELLKNFGTEKKPVWKMAVAVPASFDGVQSNDLVVMALGTGNLIARDIAEHGADRGVEVYRVAPADLHDAREAFEWEKDRDSELLVKLFTERPERFHLVRPIDYKYAELGLIYSGRQDAQKQRIRYGNQLKAEARTELLRRERTGTPVDSLEEAFKSRKQTDALWKRFEAEEKDAEQKLAALLAEIPIANLITSVKAVGPITAAGIIAAVGDIRRFFASPAASNALTELRASFDRHMKAGDYTDGKELVGEEALLEKNAFERVVTVRNYFREQGFAEQANELTAALSDMIVIGKADRRREKSCAKFIRYAGLHVMEDGRFPRREKGKRALWDPTLRQRAYILMDVFVKYPGSPWGIILRQNRELAQLRHPVEVAEEYTNKKGKKAKRMLYTPGHLLRMAKWRTATQFMRWVFGLWWQLEHNADPDKMLLEIPKDLERRAKEHQTEINRLQALAAEPSANAAK